jgi:hypothetical protein
MSMRLVVALGLGAVLAGCGGGSDETPASKPAATPQTSAPDVKPERELAPDEQAAAAVAERYAHAIADKDWAAVCETRTAAERKAFAQAAGSCPQMFEAMLKDKPIEIFATIKAGDVRIRGNVAGIDLVQPGQNKPFTTLGAVKQHGEWLLEDMKDSKIP